MALAAGRRRTIAAWVLGLMGCWACSGSAPSGPRRNANSSAEASSAAAKGAEEPGYPTPLLSPTELGSDFAMQQKVTMSHPRGEDTLRAVLQKRGDSLTLVGLAPHGGRAFVLQQTPEGIQYDSYMPRSLPFPPEYMLHDIQRTWFLSSVHRDWLRQHGERIEERTQNGRVVQRRFEQRDGSPAGQFVIRYGEGLEPGAPNDARPPDTVRFHNGWFGYGGKIETLSWQALEEVNESAEANRTAKEKSR